MLDPELQKELRDSSRTAVVLHTAMLCEPLVYIVLAVILKKSLVMKGMRDSESVLSLMRSVFILISVLVIPATVLMRRMLLSPDRIASSNTNTRSIGLAFTRAQIIVDAFAVVPATLGFVFFMVSGTMELLIALSIESLAILAIAFPRYDVVEEAAMARIARGERIELAGKELGGDA